jgi:uncharacterized protein
MQKSLSLTKYWLEQIIIGLDLCPFAQIPFREGRIHVTVCEDSDEEEVIKSFTLECERLFLEGPIKISTTLIAFPNATQDFLEFNDFVGDLEYLLEAAGLSSVFQLVAFHPHFYFEGLEIDDMANLVNRSPYPIVHIIRVEEMKKAVDELKKGEQVSFFNEKKLKALSPEKIKELFYYLT